LSRIDAAATLLARGSISPNHAVPIPFEPSYDQNVMDQRMIYAVRATIKNGDNYLFVTARHFPVLTRGHSEHVELILQRSGGTTVALVDAGLIDNRWLLRTLGGETVQLAEGQRPPTTDAHEIIFTNCTFI
jgi:putative lipoprotein